MRICVFWNIASLHDQGKFIREIWLCARMWNGDNVHEKKKELLLLRISEAKVLTILFYENISHRSFSYEKLFAIKLLVLKQAS